MKIGILTFHKSVNNGAVIQCYSLSKRLKNEFPDAIVEVIDYNMPKNDIRYSGTLASYFSGCDFTSFIKRCIKLAIDPCRLLRDKQRKKVFDSVADYLPLSPVSIYEDGCEALFNYINDNYEIVIVGSDAIWNFVVRGFPNPYFLDSSVKCGKFSYAASCYGMNYEKIPKEQKEKIKEILDTYEFLGVRDDESQKFVLDVGCQKATVHTCDPTVLLDVNDLPVNKDDVEKKLKAKGFDFTKKALAVMGTNTLCEMVKRLYGDEYQIVALYNYCKSADVNLNTITPYEWAYVFRYFKLTFTTFFHGTLLSLKNGTPVICIGSKTEYSKLHKTKIEDFLERMGMSECYFISDCKHKNIDKIKEKADYVLSNDISDFIRVKLDEEAESFDKFVYAIRKYISEKIDLSRRLKND